MPFWHKETREENCNRFVLSMNCLRFDALFHLIFVSHSFTHLAISSTLFIHLSLSLTPSYSYALINLSWCHFIESPQMIHEHLFLVLFVCIRLNLQWTCIKMKTDTRSFRQQTWKLCNLLNCWIKSVKTFFVHTFLYFSYDHFDLCNIVESFLWKLKTKRSKFVPNHWISTPSLLLPKFVLVDWTLHKVVHFGASIIDDRS